MLYTSNGSARAHQRVTAAQCSGHRHGEVDEQPDLDRAKGSRVGAGELEPDEREQADRRGPVTRPLRIAQAERPAAQQSVHRAHGGDRRATRARRPATAPPARPTTTRRTRRAADCRRPAGRTPRRSPPRPRTAAPRSPRPSGVAGASTSRRHPTRQRTARFVGVEPRPPPGERHDGERERQRPRRADERVAQRDRQIGRAAEAVGQHCDGPIGDHCTAMVAMVLFSLCSSTSTLPGTSAVNWNDWSAWPRR